MNAKGVLRLIGAIFGECPNCDTSYFFYKEEDHIPIPDEPGRCWLVFVPGAAEKSKARD